MNGKSFMNKQHRNSSSNRKFLADLGMAAYVKIHGFKCVGRKGKNFYFEVSEEDNNEFERLCIEYLNSAMHEFDSALMSLKKMGDFVQE